MIEAHAFSMYFVGNLMFIMMLGWGKEHDHKEIIEHLGVLASKYTGIDLSEIKSKKI